MAYIAPTQQASLTTKLEVSEAARQDLAKKLEIQAQAAASDLTLSKEAFARLQADMSRDKLKSDATLRDKQAELETIKARLMAAEQFALFQNKNPYPENFSNIKLGDPASKITKAFSSDELKVSDEMYKIDRSSGLFKGVIYFVDEKKKDHPVNTIVFEFSKPGHRDVSVEAFVREKIISAFGPPTETGNYLVKGRDAYRWAVNDKVWLFMSQDGSYQIGPAGGYPTYWRDR